MNPRDLTAAALDAVDLELARDVERVVAALEPPQRTTPPRMSTLAVAQACGFTRPGAMVGDGHVRALRALRRAESDGLVTARADGDTVLWVRA